MMAMPMTGGEGDGDSDGESDDGYSKNPQKITGVLGVQANFVLIHRVFFCKISLKMFLRCS